MKRVRWLLILLPLVSACGSSAPADGVASSTGQPTTTLGATPATTTELDPSTTALPTTLAPSTTIPGSVAFETSAEQASDLGFNDKRADATVVQSDVSGDLEGTMTSSLISVDGTIFGLGWFEGRAGSCGQGGMALRVGTRATGETGWEIVDGLGTGDLLPVAGNGIQSHSRFEGRLDCSGVPHPGVVSTTILEPMPNEGDSAGVPIHIPISNEIREVTPHPRQLNPPAIRVVQATYDSGVQFQIFLDKPDTSASPLRNTFATVWFLTELCGGDGIGRAFIDDVEFPEFTGAWDIPAALNSGSHGGGTFNLDSDIGRLVCA